MVKIVKNMCRKIKISKKTKLLISVVLLTFVSILVILGTSPITDTFTDETKIATSTNITVDTAAGQVKLATSWACGDTVTFTYKGSSATYGTVSSAGTECWLDRNLGASQVATSQTDSNAYGDLFQWGRLDDGHQTRTSGTTTVLSGTDNPGHSDFIKAPNSPYDWRSGQNNNFWLGVNGINNPCPSGWRIPTIQELNTERYSWSSADSAGAYASPLKFTLAGYRYGGNATLYSVGGAGRYWNTYTGGGTRAGAMRFDSGGAETGYGDRADGFSVRCIKD